MKSKLKKFHVCTTSSPNGVTVEGIDFVTDIDKGVLSVEVRDRDYNAKAKFNYVTSVIELDEPVNEPEVVDENRRLRALLSQASGAFNGLVGMATGIGFGGRADALNQIRSFAKAWNEEINRVLEAKS